MSVYLVADTHFGHRQILLYEKRPFESVEEMDRELVKRWNKTVKKGDLVIHLGDFALTGRARIYELLEKLNGKKWLIMGNHDWSHSTSWWRRAGFEEAFKQPIIYEEFFILSHRPVYLNESMPFANLHGHIHSKKMDYKGYVNMSVENWDYKPVNFEEIKKNLPK